MKKVVAALFASLFAIGAFAQTAAAPADAPAPAAKEMTKKAGSTHVKKHHHGKHHKAKKAAA